MCYTHCQVPCSAGHPYASVLASYINTRLLWHLLLQVFPRFSLLPIRGLPPGNTLWEYCCFSHLSITCTNTHSKEKAQQLLLRQVSVDRVFPKGMWASMEESVLPFSTLIYDLYLSSSLSGIFCVEARALPDGEGPAIASSKGWWLWSSWELGLAKKSSTTLWEAVFEEDTSLFASHLQEQLQSHQMLTHLLWSGSRYRGHKSNLSPRWVQLCLPWAPLRKSILNRKAWIYQEGKFWIHSKATNSSQTIEDQSCVNNWLSLVCLTDWKGKGNMFQVDTKLFCFLFC